MHCFKNIISSFLSLFNFYISSKVKGVLCSKQFYEFVRFIGRKIVLSENFLQGLAFLCGGF